jgi:putative DNA primase/helicase
MANVDPRTILPRVFAKYEWSPASSNLNARDNELVDIAVVGTAALAAATILRETHGERVGGNNEPQQIIDQVVAFIDREESRFEPDYSPLDLATKARAGWTDKNGIFEFTRDGLREATEGFDFHRVLDVLAENGSLLIPKDGKRSKVKKVNGRPTRVYPVDSTKLQPPV